MLEIVREFNNIPEGKIQVSKEDALEYQKNIINNWPEPMEVLTLRLGKYFAAFVTTVSAAACVKVFHPLLKFGLGTFTTVIPAIAFPPILVYYKIDRDLANDILVMKMDCPVCHQLKYTAYNLYAGIGFPGILGLLSTHSGLNIHVQKENAAEYWKKTFRVALDKKMIFQAAVVAQVTLSLLLPYFQMGELDKISKALKEKAIGDSSQILPENSSN